MNGIENFLLRGGEKDTKEREPTSRERKREKGRTRDGVKEERIEKEGGRQSEKTDTEGKRRKRVRVERNSGGREKAIGETAKL